jgi:hypothetical protein
VHITNSTRFCLVFQASEFDNFILQIYVDVVIQILSVISNFQKTDACKLCFGFTNKAIRKGTLITNKFGRDQFQDCCKLANKIVIKIA